MTKIRVKLADVACKKPEAGPHVAGVTIRLQHRPQPVVLVAYAQEREGQTLVFFLSFDETGVGWLERDFHKGESNTLASTLSALEFLNVSYVFV